VLKKEGKRRRRVSLYYYIRWAAKRGGYKSISPLYLSKQKEGRRKEEGKSSCG
jgi:hypothetical protein